MLFVFLVFLESVGLLLEELLESLRLESDGRFEREFLLEGICNLLNDFVR